jgi:hypothetical protein
MPVRTQVVASESAEFYGLTASSVLLSVGALSATQIETTNQRENNMESSRAAERHRLEERQPTGWTVFAGVVLFIVGSLDALWGLAAILNDEVVFVGGQGVLIADVSTWGWIHLVLGSIMAATGLGLFAAAGWARWTAIFFVMINAISQIVWFPAAPLWAFLMILLDVTIIYQLTARWEE